MVGPADVRVRAANHTDLASVVVCVNAAYEGYVAAIGRKPAPMVADYAQLIDDGWVRVAVSGAEILGVIVMWPEQDHLYVDNVAVLPEAQGRGVGAALLQVADITARESDRVEIRLYTNAAMTANLDYYPRRGYIETHRANEAGYNRVYFSKTVT
ncbi:MAG: GNAT family N-acetyltransferase [Ilumatobacteraceae bacterium]